MQATVPTWPYVIQTISVVVAAVSFLVGINAWRRTEIGKKKIELAVHTLAAFREIEQAFSEIRSPMSYSNEGLSRQAVEGESEQDAELRRRAFVAIERINNRSAKFMAAQSLRYQLEAYFGVEVIERPFQRMLELRGKIIGAANRLEHSWRQQGHQFRTEEQFTQHLERMHSAEAVFWEDSADPDPIKPQVAEMMADITMLCREVIEPSHNIAIWFSRRWFEFRRFWLCK
ncbi:hypothetical protein AB9E09_09455 [Rhizobium leguminosarum]|uniref:hypothetical protein n=1 Tax=Rhizobium leguminosarum TaxID=384 RepID=UPI001C955608|nr:hypothetical protein [Rhizobium leguminosarum]MBY5565119.1 hypothetical protein [Rhizobium leguminosarum]